MEQKQVDDVRIESDLLFIFSICSKYDFEFLNLYL